LRGLSGATIMGDGSVVLILDPHEIYLMATSQRSSTNI
jgi:two-component system, chemotaxis family, sensor kinase CheA